MQAVCSRCYVDASQVICNLFRIYPLNNIVASGLFSAIIVAIYGDHVLVICFDCDFHHKTVGSWGSSDPVPKKRHHRFSGNELWKFTFGDIQVQSANCLAQFNHKEMTVRRWEVIPSTRNRKVNLDGFPKNTVQQVGGFFQEIYGGVF